MKKFLITGMALAMLAIPATASADVARCEASVPQHQTTATFTVNQPKDTTGQFGNVWRHEFKVMVNPCDSTFSGDGPTYDNGASVPTWAENVTGSFGNGTVSFATIPVGGGATFKVTNAPMDNTTVRNVETTGRPTRSSSGSRRRRPPTRATSP